jgi:hypothetical protein
MVQRNFAVQGLVDVVAIHADYAFTPAECSNPLGREASVTNEKPPRPFGLLFDLAVKIVKVGHADFAPFFEISAMAASQETPELVAPDEAASGVVTAPPYAFRGEHQRGRPGRRQWLRHKCRPDLAMPVGTGLFRRSAVVASSGVTG